MNLYQKPKTILGKYKINEIAYCSNENHSGNYRAVASPFGILICDASTGEEKHLLPSPKSEVLSVAFSPEGNIIAGGKADNTIQLWTNWNSYDGPHDKHVLKGHGGSVASVVFSPDGKMLASGSNDGTIRLWEMVCKESRARTSGEQEIVSISHKSTLEHSGVASVVFSPDGKMLASGSNDGTIRLWESETRFGKNRCITTLEEPKIDVYPTIFISDNSRKAVTAVVFSPNNSILASGYSDGTIYLWDIRTLIPFVKQNSDEDRLFWYTNRDLSKNKIALEKKHTDSIQSLDFSSDGRTLASGSKDKTICIWDTKASQHLVTLQKHTSPVFSVVFRGEQLVSESSDGSIRFWNTETGENEKTLVGGHIGNIESVVLSPNGQVLASIGNRGWENTIIYFWDVNTGKIKNTITTKVTDLRSVYFSPDSQTFIIGSKEYDQRYKDEKTLHFWDVNTGEMKNSTAEKIEDPDKIEQVTYRYEHPDRTTFRLRIAGTGERKISIAAEIKNLKSVHLSPDSKTLLTIEEQTNDYRHSNRSLGGTLIRNLDDFTESETTLRLWDVGTGKRKAVIAGKIENLKSIHFSPDSKILFASAALKIYLWDVETGERISQPEEMTNNIEFTVLNSDKTKFVSVHSDNLIRLWDVDTGKHQSTFEGAQEDIASVAFSFDNRTLACGSRNGMILLWEITK